MISPLKLCCVWTVWKAQVYLIKGSVVADFGRSEKYHGLTYSSFYRVVIFGYFGLFSGITRNRLIDIIFF